MLSYGLIDWLQPIMRLSLFFQQQDIDVSLVRTNIRTCIQQLEDMKGSGNKRQENSEPTYLDMLKQDLNEGVFKEKHKVANYNHFETTKNKFLQAMIDNLKDRFHEEEIMSKFAVFGLKGIRFMTRTELCDYGNNELEEIAEFYSEPQAHEGENRDDFVYVSSPLLKCSSETVLEEWTYVKDFVKDNAFPTNSLSALWQTLAETFAEKKDEKGKVISPQKCGNLLTLAAIVLTHPVHTADCERAFSVQNLTVTPLRNRLSADKCDQVMRIKIEGEKIEDFNFIAAMDKWKKEKKNRMINGQKKP